MLLRDTVLFDGARLTRDGYLVGQAKIARTGIQHYTAAELGLADRSPGDIVRVYRPPEAVFDQQAMAGMAHRPVTNDHPAGSVTSKNWKQLAVGFVGGDVAQQDQKFISVPLALMDQAAIDDWQAGKRELSVGYQCELTMKDGITPEGDAYDAVQSNIKPNHLALCWKARGGSDLHFGDNEGDRTMPDNVNTRAVVVDGISYQMTDQGAQLIDRLKGLLDTSAKAMETAQAEHGKVVAAKDAELAKKDAEIADLKTKVVDGPALDALVADRAAVVAKAKAVAPTLDCSGKSNMEIKRAALGDAAKDKSDAYVDAAFDLKTADLKIVDPIRDAVRTGVQGTADGSKELADAKRARRDYLAGAHRGKAEEAAA